MCLDKIKNLNDKEPIFIYREIETSDLKNIEICELKYYRAICSACLILLKKYDIEIDSLKIDKKEILNLLLSKCY